MPKPGQKTVTLKESVYLKIEAEAKKRGKKVATWVQEVILEKLEDKTIKETERGEK